MKVKFNISSADRENAILWKCVYWYQEKQQQESGQHIVFAINNL